MAGILRRGIGQPEQDHCAIAHEAGDDALMAHRLLIDERMKAPQHLARFIEGQKLAQAREARQVDEDHGCLLAHRLRRKAGILGQPLGEARRLEAAQGSALHG